MAGDTGSITLTVIVSAVTSGIVSLATFIVGVRLAKDNGDRATLRGIYQRLFGHFQALQKAIDDGQPKGWSSFPLKDGYYRPAFRQMQDEGESNMLPPKISAERDALEDDALSKGARYRCWVREGYIPQLQGLVSDRTLGKTSSITGRTYRELAATELGLMSPAEVERYTAELVKDNWGIGLDLATEQGKTNRVYIYAESLQNGTLSLFLNDAAALASADAEGAALIAEVHALAARIATLLGRLRSRIRDPHPLFESVLRALRDLRPA